MRMLIVRSCLALATLSIAAGAPAQDMRIGMLTTQAAGAAVIGQEIVRG